MRSLHWRVELLQGRRNQALKGVGVCGQQEQEVGYMDYRRGRTLHPIHFWREGRINRQQHSHFSSYLLRSFRVCKHHSSYCFTLPLSEDGVTPFVPAIFLIKEQVIHAKEGKELFLTRLCLGNAECFVLISRFLSQTLALNIHRDICAVRKHFFSELTLRLISLLACRQETLK